MASCGRRHEQSALLFVDLDNFKLLNDTYGHEAGDRLLVDVANRMRLLVRRNDTVARLAGDEFVILLDGLSTDAALATKKAARVAAKALDTLRRPFDVGPKQDFEITASIGVIIYDETATSADDILRQADLAMYDVKRSGRNAYKVFRPGRESDSVQRVEISESLAGAATRNELELRFQPQVDMAGEITGAEALLRWNHPKLGLLTPDLFMGIAEQNGTIAELNRYVIEEAVRVLQSWSSFAEAKHLSLSVNLGSEQLLRPDFARELRNLLRSRNIRNGALVLELTEDLISKCRDDSAKILAQIKTTGVNISLDDFGAGFTSLAGLKELPLDEIKIDGRFVKGMSSGKNDMAIVKSILALAEALNMTAVAEHVETQAQEDMLAASGCVRFQGFLYGGALSLADFEQMAGFGIHTPVRKAG